eukprot:CAMPEP_0176456736 /NCGR_PEP_ID=MMETSP0127-20121128/31473_1 /TAXON_ID=938130 /ORGANISM="Platyophrya macrostoma, Strain WH" /LENGTH=218 /DNA_ID=CAMNT_0017846767 /DNA_START=37 /DNA_END=693 /DNA_ORIENTATION=-
MINLFRLTGDIIHLLSFVILIQKIRRSKNCLGLSLKTQELYLTVFLTRYLDIYYYWSYQTYYLFFMKLLFIGCTAYTIYLMKFEKPYCLSYDPTGDDFPHWKVLIPGAMIAALIIHRDWTFLDYLWSFSIWLEAVTIFPQLSMLSKISEVENITGTYVASLGIYRIFYILNWIYRYFFDDFFCLTSVLGGLLQAGLYADFLYYYFKGVKTSRKIPLPA